MKDQAHRKFSSCIIHCHFFFSLICFCNKNNAISTEAIEGETTQSPAQRMTPTDCKGFWHGFNHQATRYRTARMEPPTEARPAARKIASTFAARKSSSSIYQHTSTTSIRRTSTLQWRTPHETHSYNEKFKDMRALGHCLNRRSSRAMVPPVILKDKEVTRRTVKIPTVVLATWTHKYTVHWKAAFIRRIFAALPPSKR